MFDYAKVFANVEATVLDTGSRNKPIDEIKRNLQSTYDISWTKFSDNDFYLKIVDVIFYSGFRAQTVTSKIDVIHSYFSNIETVAAYTDAYEKTILADSSMIKNRQKIKACISAARNFVELKKKFGSFQNYIRSFSPDESFENLMLFKEDLSGKFQFLGPITSYHLMMDLGLQVMKPDRVICRIFQRLNLIDNPKQLLKTIIHARRFAHFSRKPIRYVDIIFVLYGQVRSEDFGILNGICLEKKPNCQVCRITQYCKEYANQISCE